jgi:acyl-CoA synthetase (AMP-forming)/AMP-acid ligase II
LSQVLAAFDPGASALWTARGAWRFGEMAQAFDIPALRSVRSHPSVALKIEDPARLAIALAGLDGFVDRVTLIAHDAPETDMLDLLQQAAATLVLTDGKPVEGFETLAWTAPIEPMAPGNGASPSVATQWLVATSGTTGRPKLVGHTLSSLTRTVRRSSAREPIRWGLLYDICRFAGVQVLLQSLVGGGLLVAPDPKADLAGKLQFFIEAEVTALSATPTMWRKILMTPQSHELDLRQITLGGEIVDDAILAALATRFPKARLVHIYASTEAGAAFSVSDGRAGFPASFLDTPPKGIRLRIEDERLRVKSEGRPSTYVGSGDSFSDAEGFVDTGDVIERRGDRCYFLGRSNGLINVGGNKLFPEEVEGVLLAHPFVRFARVSAKSSPITGQLVIAEVVLEDDAPRPPEINPLLMAHCRANLPGWKTPAMLRVVAELTFGAGGKMQRTMR